MQRTSTTQTWRMPTALPRIRAALFFVLCAATVGCGSAQTAALKPLTSVELQSAQAGLDKSLLPDGAGSVQVAGKQAFRLQEAGQTIATLVPIQFTQSEPGLVKEIPRVTTYCGVFLTDSAGKTRFQQVDAGGDSGLIQCSGVDGVGLAHGSATHPTLLLLFRVHTVSRTWSDPYTVSWSDGDKRYVMESLPIPAGIPAKSRLTIPQLRIWLKSSK